MKSNYLANVANGALLVAVGVLGWTLCAQAATAPQTASATASDQATRSVREGVYTAPQTKRGAAIYARECASCHGETLTAGEAPSLAGEEFLAQWYGYSAGDLFERMRQTMPPTGREKLSAQDFVDILAYVLSVNKFPAGNTELGSRSESLKQIRIEGAAPRPKPQN